MLQPSQAAVDVGVVEAVDRTVVDGQTDIDPLDLPLGTLYDRRSRRVKTPRAAAGPCASGACSCRGISRARLFQNPQYRHLAPNTPYRRLFPTKTVQLNLQDFFWSSGTLSVELIAGMQHEDSCHPPLCLNSALCAVGFVHESRCVVLWAVAPFPHLALGPRLNTNYFLSLCCIEQNLQVSPFAGGS